MAALTQGRDTKSREGRFDTFPVEANTMIYAGAQVCLNAAGNAVPGQAGIGLVCVGRAEKQANNLDGANPPPANIGTAGAINVRCQRGAFAWDNSSGGDAIAEANVGAHCFMVDDHTVALTNGNGTRSLAGTIYDLDPITGEVWVDSRLPQAPAKRYICVNIADLKAADDGVYHVPSPVSGRITNIFTSLQGALTVGNATLTASIGGTNVTNGVVTLVEAASAAGQVNSATPTALNAVEAGQDIELTVGGTNTAIVAAVCVIEITE